MANRNTIKGWFQRGMKPTAAQFAAWIDSFWHKDDAIQIADVEGLWASLAGKAGTAVLDAHTTDTGIHVTAEAARWRFTASTSNRTGNSRPKESPRSRPATTQA